MKTDNSYMEQKKRLREMAVSMVGKRDVRVLDCFAGKGTLWGAIKDINPNDIKVTSIEKEKGKYPGNHLHGDNRKFLPVLDLRKYDIIDLDAYGVPYEQLRMLFERRYQGIVVVTCIQLNMPSLPSGMLEDIGYTPGMIRKCRMMLSKDGHEKMFRYLHKHGVDRIEGYFYGRKNYFLFSINN